ncbi:hypothetical protein PENTCL1PPCAC_24945, partial [Pristionchus entomophagus]
QVWFNSILISTAWRMLDHIPVKGLLYLSLLITFNRLAVFVHPSWRVVFDRSTIMFSILACWAWILAMCAQRVIVT